MKKIFIAFLFLALTCNLAFAKELKPIINIPQAGGASVKLWFHPDEIEYSDEICEYESTTVGSTPYYERRQIVLSYPYTVMSDTGKVYADGTRVKDGKSFNSTRAWNSDCFGTKVEYDFRTILMIERLFLYAADEQGNVVKYKINKKPWLLIFEEEYYEPVAVYKQTVVGDDIKNEGFKYDKNGREVYYGPKKFSEIKEYDMQGNVTAIYRKNILNQINEYTPDGKLKTKHLTSYIPYLQWSENYKNGERKSIYRRIEDYRQGLEW